MARTAQGWKLGRRSGTYHVRFTHQGQRYFISTRTRDPVEATATAAQIYRDVVSGKLVRSRGSIVHPQHEIAPLAAQWLEAIESELGEGTPNTFAVYARHWVRQMRLVSDLTSRNVADYSRERLRQVQSGTVRKELSALRRFLSWLSEQGLVAQVPEIVRVPKKALGTKRPSSRPKAAELTKEEVSALLDALPELSRGLPVRAYCVFAYETALRPQGTIDRIEWRDLTPFGLHIRPECDKNRWERTVPLSDRAKAALENTPRTGGKIFGKHDLRESFDAAVEKALGGPRTGATVYALKHARITHWFEDGASIPAVKFLTGITQTATLDRYARASRRSAEQLLTGANPVQIMVQSSAKGGT